MAAINEPTAKVITTEDNTLAILLPIREDEPLECPLCANYVYRGARKIENFVRHAKLHHAELTTTFKCWNCGFVAPANKRYPRKVVSEHCAECVTVFRGVRAGATDTARRANIRHELLAEPAADAGSASRPRRRPTRQQQSTAENSITAPTPAHGSPSSTTAIVPATHNNGQPVSPETAPTPPTARHTARVAGDSSSDPVPTVAAGTAPQEQQQGDSNVNNSNIPTQPTDAAELTQRRVPPRALEQRQLALDLSHISNAEELQAIMPRVVEFLGGRRGVDDGGGDGRRATNRRRQAESQTQHSENTDRIQAAKSIQGLYRKKRKTAVQRILAGDNSFCNIDVAAVESHFRHMAARRAGGESWPDVFTQDDPTSESCERLCEPIGEKEIVDCLKRRADTSPGPDGLKYSDIRRADPDARVLAALFNAVWRIEAVPSSWGTTNTILLHKKGSRDDVKNWRPISLGDTVPKLFAAILSDRVKKWATSNGRFSAAQKGFLSFEGCFEHNFVLGEIIRDAKQRGKEVIIAWLDLTSAFDSIPHSSISRALEGHGVPIKMRNVINSLYSSMSTSVRVADGTTAPIHVQSGVRQGCPLSPDVFNLTIEVMLRNLASTDEGYTIEGQRFNSLFYADDGALIADSTEGMKRLLEAAETGARAVGITFNPAKCATLHVTGEAEDGVRQTVFSVQGTSMPALASTDFYEHLGIPTGYQIRQTPTNTIRDLLNDAKKIGDSLLAPWQKLDAVGTFLLPRLDFIMQGGVIEKEYLTEADKIIKKLAKEWLSLPQRASAEPVYLPPSQGGGGLLPLADLYELLTVAHSYRLLYAKDQAVRQLAEALLRGTVSGRLRRQASNVDVARYLSGDPDMPPSSATTSFWARVRQAAGRLKNRINLQWRWDPDQDAYTIKCGEEGETVSPENKHRVANLLRRALVGHYAKRLLAKRDQGKVFEVTRGNSVSNHFLRSGRNTRFCDWRFIHRARLNVLPVNAAIRGIAGLDKSCRRCGHALESLPHVLNHCGPHAAARQLRHNGIQDRLLKAARCAGSIRVNRTVEGTRGAAAALRPDIVVRGDSTRRIDIIDVCVSFENRKEAFRQARQEKMAKYQPIIDQLAAQGYTVTVEAFIVGALGGWDSRNEGVLNTLGISKRYAGMMKRLMVSDVVRWSRDIYVEHVSGMRQYRTEH